MLSELAGRVAVVTGGASGIGLALARQLKREGMRLVLADCEAGPLDQAAAELGAQGVVADVRDPASLRELARSVGEMAGPPHLVCANAGVSRMAGIERLNDQDWRWLFDVNLFGVVETVRAFLPALKANPDGGQILITASLSSLYPTRSQGAYAASKYAVAGFGEVLALELAAEGSRVGVSLLCPGPVRTSIGSSARNRGEAYGSAGTDAPGPDIHEQAFRAEVRDGDWSSADEVAAAAVEGIKRGDLWIVTHPQMMGPVRARHRAIEAAS
jgi:NAD(P)-dependent dehydrogenase (short-subunit alcohol dehydrogenase family)